MSRLYNILRNIIVPSSTLSLGAYNTASVLTGSASRITFSIPTGRVYPTGTTVTKVVCNINARTSNANGTGTYVVHKVGTSADWATFDSTSNFIFNNGANDTVSLAPNNITISLQGGTNVYVSLQAPTSHFFSGSQSNTNILNNNATVVELRDIVIYFDIPQ